MTIRTIEEALQTVEKLPNNTENKELIDYLAHYIKNKDTIYSLELSNPVEFKEDFIWKVEKYFTTFTSFNEAYDTGKIILRNIIFGVITRNDNFMSNIHNVYYTNCAESTLKEKAVREFIHKITEWSNKKELIIIITDNHNISETYSFDINIVIDSILEQYDLLEYKYGIENE